MGLHIHMNMVMGTSRLEIKSIVTDYGQQSFII